MSPETQQPRSAWEQASQTQQQAQCGQPKDRPQRRNAQPMLADPKRAPAAVPTVKIFHEPAD